MNETQIWNLICMLAKGQGLYGRIKQTLLENGQKDAVLSEWAQMNFQNDVDFILYIEG